MEITYIFKPSFTFYCKATKTTEIEKDIKIIATFYIYIVKIKIETELYRNNILNRTLISNEMYFINPNFLNFAQNGPVFLW